MAIVDVIRGPDQPLIGTQDSLSTAKLLSVLVDDVDNDDSIWLRQQSHADIPNDGDSYSSKEPWLRAVERRIAGRFPLLLMTINYKLPNVRGSQQGPVDGAPSLDPLQDPPDISWMTEPRTVVIDKDVFGFPIKTPGGEQLSPLPTREVADSTLTIGINQASWDNMALEAYKMHVNDATWMNYPSNTGRLRIANANKVYFGQRSDPSAFYWRATYQISFRYLIDPVSGEETNWMLDWMLQGFREYVNGKSRAIVLDDGTKPAKPWPLQIDGSAMSSLIERTNIRFWEHTHVYERANFQSLFEPLGIIE